MTFAHLLRNVSLFAQINDDELDALASDLLPQSFHKNQVLFQQGSTTSSLYIVRTGSIQVTAFGRNHEVAYVGVYGPEQCFGEFSLLDGLPRSGEAVALANSELLVLTRPAFFRFLEQHPTVAVKLLVTVSRRMRFAEAAIDHPTLLNAEQKIANVLLEIAERYGASSERYIGLGMRLSGDDLASLAGVTRDAANAIVSRLKLDGVLMLERAHVVSIDVERLRTLAGSSALAEQT
jgi:CRP/FNR family transcriptional regulator, cyclic AMP receptor protein